MKMRSQVALTPFPMPGSCCWSLVMALVWTGQNRFPFCLDASCYVEYATAHSHTRFLDIRKHDGIVG